MKPKTRCFSSSLICSCAISIGENSTRTSVTSVVSASVIWGTTKFSPECRTPEEVFVAKPSAALCFLTGRLVLPDEFHPSAGKGGSIWIDHRSVDASGNRWIRKLCARGGRLIGSGCGLALLRARAGGSLWRLGMGGYCAKLGNQS